MLIQQSQAYSKLFSASGLQKQVFLRWALLTALAKPGWAPSMPSSPTDRNQKIYLCHHFLSSSPEVNALPQEQAGLDSEWLTQQCSSVSHWKYQHWYHNINWSGSSKRNIVPERWCSNRVKTQSLSMGSSITKHLQQRRTAVAKKAALPSTSNATAQTHTWKTTLPVLLGQEEAPEPL